MKHYIIDFETRSRCNLKVTNATKYSKHSTTEVICLGYAEGNEPPQIWVPGQPFPFPDWPNCFFDAYNADFELAIWNNVCTRLYDWPELSVDNIDCIQAACNYAGLQRNLAKICETLALGEHGKDADGHRVMLQLTKPRGCKGVQEKWLELEGGKFLNDTERLQKCYEYCKQDINTERYIKQLAPPIPFSERLIWEVSREINQRGIPIDRPLCEHVVWMVDQEMERLRARVEEITDGKITSPDQHIPLRKWINEQGVKYNGRVTHLTSIDKDTVEGLLNMPEYELPSQVKEALECRRLCSDKAVTKFRGVLNHADDDDRCRDAHLYYLAGTGRFQGVGVNFLNLRRLRTDKDDNPIDLELAERIAAANKEELIDIMHELHNMGGANEGGVLPALGPMIRLGIKAAPGKKLVVRDYSAIEMRMVHWLAGDERMLNIIRDFDNGIGKEPYKLAAAMMFDVLVDEVTGEQRRAGKVYYLGNGYVSGGAKIQGMANNMYGLDIDLETANEWKNMYRRENPLVPRLWYAYQKASLKCVGEGKRVEVRGVEFFMHSNTFCIRLPSGRVLKYYDPHVIDGMYGPEVECENIRPTGGKRRWVGITTLIENIDQGASRDLLCDALLKCKRANLPVVLHVYDEIVLEVDENDDKAYNTLRDIMKDTPAWAKGLPVDVKGGESQRYTK